MLVNSSTYVVIGCKDGMENCLKGWSHDLPSKMLLALLFLIKKIFIILDFQKNESKILLKCNEGVSKSEGPMTGNEKAKSSLKKDRNSSS